MSKARATNFALAAVISSALSLAVVSQASAASLAVELACASDYYAYCSKHDPDGPGVRNCFRVNGEKLSSRCLKALVKAGELSKSELEPRAAAK
jgi:hypothetical protein